MYGGKGRIGQYVVFFDVATVVRPRVGAADDGIAFEGKVSFIIDILDGAHNPEAMKNLCERSIYSITKEKPIHVVFCCFRDKNLGGMLSSLGEITDDLTLTTFDNPRARSVDEYFLFLGDYPFKENAKELIQEKINNFPNDAILVTGSLAFAAYVRDLLEKGEIKHEVEPLKE